MPIPRDFMLKLTGILLFLVQISLLTFFRNVFGMWSSFMFFADSLLLGLLFFQGVKNKEPRLLSSSKNVLSPLLWAAIALGLIVVQFPLLHTIFQAYPIAYASGSDILPQMDVMLERTLQGEFPYKPIQAPNGLGECYTIHSPYLPMFWLPFLLPKSLGIDFRWLIYAFFGLVVALQTFLLARKNAKIEVTVLSAFFPALILYGCVYSERLIIGHTAEFMIVSYYMLCCLSLFFDSLWVRVTTLILCILSKYLLIFWVPFYLFVIWKKEGAKEFSRLSLFVLAGVLLLYVVPLMLFDPYFIGRSLAHHAVATKTFWTWQYILDKGVGMALYYAQSFPFDTDMKIKLLQATQLLTGIGSLIGMGIYYLRTQKTVNYRLFSLFTLNLHLVFIYHFIQSPFVYYFTVPVFVSMTSLLFYLKNPE